MSTAITCFSIKLRVKYVCVRKKVLYLYNGFNIITLAYLKIKGGKSYI